MSRRIYQDKTRSPLAGPIGLVHRKLSRKAAELRLEALGVSLDEWVEVLPALVVSGWTPGRAERIARWDAAVGLLEGAAATPEPQAAPPQNRGQLIEVRECTAYGLELPLPMVYDQERGVYVSLDRRWGVNAKQITGWTFLRVVSADE